MATMRDVAERAGVSVTTVSHVLNNTRPVSDRLRRRVLAAMAEMEYQPNRLARSLRRGDTYTLGMIVPDINNPFFSELARGVEDTGFAGGYSVILCNADFEEEKEQHYVNVLVEKQVDGLLLVAAGLSLEHIQGLLERKVPLVLVDREVAGMEIDTVLVDNRQGAWLGVCHLLEQGHRRIGYIGGPAGLSTSEERLAGYRQALADAGLAPDQQLLAAGNFQHDGGYHAARELLAAENPPTALFAANDLMAIGAVRAALQRGYTIPDNLSLVGFDDVPLARYTNPPLTTVAQPIYEMGVVATELLLKRLRRPGRPAERRMLQPELRLRHSTSAPAAVRAETMEEGG